jgi:flagellar protein FliS
MNQVYSIYNQIDISTSNPLKIVLMLYDGAINFLNRAIRFADKGDIKHKNIYANKTRDIIEELNNSLNTEAGDELARQLRSLYFFMNRHLMKANWADDTKGMQEVVDMLANLREAWRDAYHQQQTGNLNAQPMTAGVHV